MEPNFEQEEDRLFLFKLEDRKVIPISKMFATHESIARANSRSPLQGSVTFFFQIGITLEEVPWSKQGDTVGWLTSEIFGLKQARSQEAEIAIEAAEAWIP